MTLGVLFNTDRMSAHEFIDYAQRADALGLESVWLPELFTRDPFAAAGVLLANTKTLTIGTGIANIYGRDATAMVAAANTLQELSDGRFILGLGVSNAGLNQTRGHEWQNPVTKLTRYLQDMSSVKLTCPQVEFPVHVAAHGPKMLAAVADHADGANTYLMPADHARVARAALGSDKTINTMLFCLHEADPDRARATARKAIAYYVGLDYYHRAWRQFGFDDADFADGGSDRLVDAVIAWGDMDQIRARLQGQYDAGANRVIVIPLGRGGQPDWTLLEALAA